MRVQVVLRQANLFGLRIRAGKLPAKQGVLSFGALRVNPGHAFSGQRLNGRQECAGAVFPVFIVFL